MRTVAWPGVRSRGLARMFATLAHVAMMLTVAAAGPLEDAHTAEQRGDYAAELALLRPLADQGSAVAQAGDGGAFGAVDLEGEEVIAADADAPT